MMFHLARACALVAVALISQIASSQAAEYAVVGESGAAMRAGDMPRFYRVTTLEPGTLVQVLGESNGWAEVVYPESLNVYVEASRSRKIDDTTIELTKPSSLLAPSALLGASGSWCPLYEEPLPVGTRLELVEEAVGLDQKVTKYLVKPPRALRLPRGFVKKDQLRTPTPAELASVSRPDEGATPARATDDPEPGKVAPPKEDVKTVEAREEGPPTYEGVDTSLLGPIVTRDLPPVQATGQAETLATDGVAQPKAVEPSRDLATLTIMQLNQAFDELRSLPREQMDAGLEELLAECRRSAKALASEPALVESIQQRIRWIELRMKLRDQRRRIQQTLDEADQRRSQLAEQIRAWQTSRSYTVIGRVSPSTLYDGNRLPLMYRVESVDGRGYQRTIGYLRPGPGEDYEELIGAIVGVIGQSTFDSALGVRIITPERIDPLDPQSP